MESIVPANQQHTITEDSSDRSESSTMSQEYQIRGFESYEIVKRLNLSVGERGVARDEKNSTRNKDFRVSVESIGSIKEHQDGSMQLDEVNDNLIDLGVSIGKSKEFDFQGRQIGDPVNYQMDKSRDVETTMEMSTIGRTKEMAMKEAFQARQKYLNSSFERSPKKLNYLVGREIKEYGLAKGYNLSIDRMKEFNLPLDRMRDCHMTVLPRERFNNIGILENSRILESNDHRNLQVHSRNSQDLETMAYERMRRSQHHLLNRMDFTAQNLVGTQLPHARQSIANQIQQSQQQQQQQPQIKSFTIEAILAHRNNQKERHRCQQQQLRKAARQECQEVSVKTVNSITVNNVNVGGSGSGKAKRVRTIFTAEQLERLEGEFARQQYMVGPERLYLAHALRLTEAQVKVWFQNRRIKWRKVNHEQQCQAVTEHRQRCTLPSLEIHEIHEDESNDNNGKWCNNTNHPASIIATKDASSPCSQIHELGELRHSPIAKP